MQSSVWLKAHLMLWANRMAAATRGSAMGAAGRSVRRWLSAVALACFWTLGAGIAVGADVVQEFYLPMPEPQVHAVFHAQAPFDPPEVNMVALFSIVITTPDTSVCYDQWEDGYEADLNAPTNSSTQVWGDGDDGNGICPGFANDPFGLPAGTVITLKNEVPVPRDFNTHPYLYDAGDRVGGTKAITISRACWESYQRGTAQASAVEVISTLDHGVHYIAPVGIDTPAYGMFSYVDLMVMADMDDTTVIVDPDGTGTSVTTNIIDRGALGAFLVNAVSKGATVRADKPIQVHMITGNLFNGQFETRSFVLRPVELWSSKYIIPVGTVNSNYPGVAYLYNTNAAPLAVTYTTRTGGGVLMVPGSGGLTAFTLPTNSATLLEAAGGLPFFAICAMDCVLGEDPSEFAPRGADFDWGFAPIPFEGLTTEAVCGWGPGADTNFEFWVGTENGSPVWITALSNTTLYVDFGGDRMGPLTDPNGGQYDTNLPIAALQVAAVYDRLANDQTALRVYTVDGVVISGAWGEDAGVASPGPPFLDMGYALVPFPVASFIKTSRIVEDTTPTNVLNVGDVVEYSLRVSNRSLLPLGNLVVFDVMPVLQLFYLPGTTMLNGVPVPDDDPGTGTVYPLDLPGRVISVPRQQESTFTYRCLIIGSGTILNYATAATDPENALVSTNTIFASTPIFINGASVIEGNVGTTDMVFTVTLLNVSTGDVSVAFATSNGTATAGIDYIATNGTLTIPAGSTNGFITVQVIGDLDMEANETLFVNLSEAGGGGIILGGDATGLIIDDDGRFEWQVDWKFNPRRDSWYGTLTLANPGASGRSLAAPSIWYEVQTSPQHRLRFPTGVDTNKGPDWLYFDLSAAFTARVAAIGDRDLLLDPGESVVVSTNIELWGRGSVTNPPLVDDLVATNWVFVQAAPILPPTAPGATLPPDGAEDKAPVIAISGIRLQGGQAVLEWPGVTSWYFTVQTTPSLIPFVEWSNLTGCVELPGVNGIMSATDTEAGDGTSKAGDGPGAGGVHFYRVKMTQ